MKPPSKDRLRKAADRSRAWRAANPELNRAREMARHRKRKAEEPEKLRASGRRNAANWRKNNPERDRENRARWRKANPLAARRNTIKYRYGMSLEDWEALFKKQRSRCAICLDTEGVRGWCVDHCHTTDRVRGILCHDCNTALGFMRDDPVRLRKAAKYLGLETTAKP